MSVTFETTAVTHLVTHYTVTCCCDVTTWATADTFADADALASALTGEVEAPCCGDTQAWPTQVHVGDEAPSVNLASNAATAVLLALHLDPSQPWGEAPAPAVAASCAAVLADAGAVELLATVAGRDVEWAEATLDRLYVLADTAGGGPIVWG